MNRYECESSSLNELTQAISDVGGRAEIIIVPPKLQRDFDITMRFGTSVRGRIALLANKIYTLISGDSNGGKTV